jgi:uncharacterized lipoprotein
MMLRRCLLPALAATTLLSGCNLLAKLQPDCHSRQDYRAARQLPPLTVPPGLDSPNTAGSLSIPTVELTPPPPGKNEQCLDVPPRYLKSPTNKAASG